MTDLEIKNVLAPMVAHVGKSMTNEQIGYWHRMLDDIPYEAAKRAVVATLRDYEYAGFPPVGLVRKNAGAKSAMSIEDRATKAWSVVRSSIAPVGGYKSVQFDDPITTATVRMLGGWSRFCECPPGDKLDRWLQKEFVGAYQLLMRTGIKAEQAKRLPGIIEAQRKLAAVDAPGDIPVEVIPVGLPELDKNLVRGVIRDERTHVALPGPAMEIGRMEPLPVDLKPIPAAEPMTAEEFEAKKAQAKQELKRAFGVRRIADSSEKPFSKE